MSLGWTPERIEQLRTLAGEGLTAGQIKRLLGGVTRNAVIGKMRRNGIPLTRASNGGKKPPRETPPPRRDREPRIVAPALQPAMVEPPPTGGVPLIDTGFFSCRFPLWGDTGGAPDYRVCGARTPTIGGSWCAHHAQLVGGRGTYPERKAASHAASIAKAEGEIGEVAA